MWVLGGGNGSEKRRDDGAGVRHTHRWIEHSHADEGLRRRTSECRAGGGGWCASGRGDIEGDEGGNTRSEDGQHNNRLSPSVCTSVSSVSDRPPPPLFGTNAPTWNMRTGGPESAGFSGPLLGRRRRWPLRVLCASLHPRILAASTHAPSRLHRLLMIPRPRPTFHTSSITHSSPTLPLTRSRASTLCARHQPAPPV